MSCFVSNGTVIYEKINYPLLKWYEREKHVDDMEQIEK